MINAIKELFRYHGISHREGINILLGIVEECVLMPVKDKYHDDLLRKNARIYLGKAIKYANTEDLSNYEMMVYAVTMLRHFVDRV